MTQFYTYLHTRPDGSIFYVGKGSGKRSTAFFRNRNIHYKNTINKYGVEHIGVFVFLCESEEQAFADERQQIAQLRKAGERLVNRTDGGEGCSGMIMSISAREKVAKANKGNKNHLGHKHSEETIAKIKRAVNTPEVKAKKSLRHKGKTVSVEQRAKLSAANKGKKLSEETIKKIKETTSTPEFKAMVSARFKGKKLTPEHCATLTKVRTGKTRPYKPWSAARRAAC